MFSIWCSEVLFHTRNEALVVKPVSKLFVQMHELNTEKNTSLFILRKKSSAMACKEFFIIGKSRAN